MEAVTKTTSARRETRFRIARVLCGGAILAASLALTAIFTSPAALAACSSTNPASGTTVTCVDAETNTVGNGSQTQVTVNVQSGASITVGNNNTAITLDAQNVINNSGTLFAGNNSASIALGGQNNTVTNNGTIRAGNATGFGESYAIFLAGDNNIIVNNSTMIVGNSGTNATAAVIGALSDFNQITNNGTLTGGTRAIGIGVCCSNTIVNSASGTVTVGDSGRGINVSDFNTVTNAGTIVAGNTLNGSINAVGIVAQFQNTVINTGRITVGNGDINTNSHSFGIMLTSDMNTATNSGTIVVGDFAQGIGLYPNFNPTGNTLTNAAGGRITAGNMSLGINAVNPGNTATNNGTIIVGDTVNFIYSAGIVIGDGTATNTGTITVGNGDSNTGQQSFGIRAQLANAIVQNSGLISVGTYSAGIATFADSAQVTNAGTIIAGANGTGIDIGFGTFGSMATNSGTITAGTDGFGVNLQGAATLINSGTIRALGGTAHAVHGCNCAPSNFTNSGTVDGRIALEGGGTVINSGLITITANDATQAVGTMGTHIVGDSFTQTASGTLALRVTGDGRSDTLGTSSTTSTVALAGALRVLVQSGLYANTTTYNNVVTTGTSGSLTGQFSSVTTTSQFLTASAVYNPLDVQLTLTRIAFNAAPNLTPNQRAVGTALENAYSPNLTGNAATFYTNLFSSTAPAAAFDQLSGQGVSASQGAAFGAGSQFGSTMFSQSLNGGTNPNTLVFDPAPLQYAPAQKPRGHEAFAALPTKAPPIADLPGRWRVWSAGFGSDSRWSGEAATGIASQKSRTYGGVIGVDHQLTRDFLIGIAAGGSETSFSASDIATSGRATGGHVGIYAVKTWNAFYAAASLSYARFANSTTRTITGIGPTETATGSFSSDFFGSRIELGWRQAYRGFFVTPFVAVEPSALYQYGFIENNVQAGGVPGILGLTFASKSTTSLPTFVGAQFDTRHSFANGWALSPFVRASWVHEFRPDRQVSASFVTLPGAAFTVDGARAASDSARLDTGARLTMMPGKSLFANFTGEWSSRSTSYGAAAGFRAAW